jgi:membrane protein YdbS with pleckstrin-like domain
MIHENDLVNHGFNEDDIARLQASSAKTGTEMDTLLNDLANRFKALTWVLSVMLLIFVATLLAGSKMHAISFGVAVVVLGTLFTITMPLKLAYKSWQYRRKNLISPHHPK